MIRNRLMRILLATLFVSVPLARAGEKLAVQVVFDFAERQYRRELGSTVAGVERRALDLILADLNRNTPFLRFTAEPQSGVLHVRLGNSSGGGELHEINFQLSVDGTDPVGAKPLQSGTIRWNFRPASAYDSPLGSADALATEIGLRFQQADHTDFVHKVLSGIPIALGQYR